METIRFSLRASGRGWSASSRYKSAKDARLSGSEWSEQPGRIIEEMYIVDMVERWTIYRWNVETREWIEE